MAARDGRGEVACHLGEGGREAGAFDVHGLILKSSDSESGDAILGVSIFCCRDRGVSGRSLAR